MGLWPGEIRVSPLSGTWGTNTSLSSSFTSDFKSKQMNFSDLESGDMLLARDNLNLTAEDEEVTLRLTHYLVPVAFGLIFTLGLLGNFMVIGVVRIL